jgi:hypothetical protein
MPHAYYGILVGLSESTDGQALMSEVAAFMGFSPSRLSHAVAKMEQDGWVRRKPCPDDGRSVRRYHGRAAWLPRHQATSTSSAGSCSPPHRDEQHQLRTACDRIIEALAAETSGS